MPIHKKIGRLLLMLCFALWAVPVVAAEPNSVAIHHPDGSEGSGAMFRVWRLNDADAAKERTALGKELADRTAEELDALYPGGIDSEPADAQGVAVVSDLADGRYYIRPKELGTKLQYFVVDLPEKRNGFVYSRVDTYPKETDVDTNSALVLIKLDGDTKQPLAGAVFHLYEIVAPTGKRTLVRDDLVTADDGRVRVANLPPGDYRLIEAQAPPGYAPIGERSLYLGTAETAEWIVENFRETPPNTEPSEVAGTESNPPVSPKEPKPPNPGTFSVPSTGDSLQFLCMGSGITLALIGVMLYARET